MTETAQKPRASRKSRVGQVVADKMNKTIIVRAERRVRHPLYGKFIKRFKKYYVHDENNQAHVGDTVRIMETKPLSKLKRWRLIEVVAKHED